MKTIAHETLLQFLEREGPVSTYSASSRFGLTLSDTRKALNALVRQGTVEKNLQRFTSPHCAMYGWRLTASSLPAARKKQGRLAHGSEYSAGRISG